MQSSSAAISWAVPSTQVMSSLSVSSVPSHVSFLGHVLHQVIDWLPPPTGSQLPALQVLPFWTVPPMFISQSSRSTATEQLLPVVLQQKGGSGTGSRLLPHLFTIRVSSLSADLSSPSRTVPSARQVARSLPARPHFSSTF